MQGIEKTAFSLVIGSFLLGACIRSVPAFPAEPAAEISIEETTHRFGTVLLGETAAASFPFDNAGEDSLTLTPELPGDNRLYVRISPGTVEPGGTGIIEVFMPTGGLFGEVTDSVTVLTNDPDRREVTLTMTGTVRPVVVPVPAVVDIGEVGKEDSYRGMVRLAGLLADEGRLAGVRLEPSSPFISGEITGERTGNDTIPVLEFVLAPGIKAGSIEQTIAITSEDPPAESFLRVFGKKLGDIQVVPERLVMVRRWNDDPDEKTLTIEGESPFHIMGVEDLTALLDVSTRIVVEGSKYELVARLKNPLEEKKAIGRIVVHTDMENQPLLEIPVILAVLPE